MKDLSELLATARQYADLTGDGALYLAPGVTTAEAHVAAWHAIAVQGGHSTPSREAWRLACDKQIATVAEMHAALHDPGALNVTDVNQPLVRKAIGDHDYIAGAAALTAALPPTKQQPAEQNPAEQNVNDRGEFTGTDGKLYHLFRQTVGGDGNYEPGPITHHEGDWLTCDTCNPVVTVEVERDFSLPLAAARSAYAEAKEKADAAAEELKAATAKLKAAITEASGGAYRARLEVPGYKAVNLTYVESWRLDTKRLKAEQPAVYVEFVERSGSWRLEQSKAATS